MGGQWVQLVRDRVHVPVSCPLSSSLGSGANMTYSVFLFYGMAATAYSYVISLFAPSQLAAIAMTCIVQVVIAMLFFVG